MKHILKVLLCALMIALIMVSVASAAPSTMNITWKGNYTDTNTELVVTFKSPATYPQRVTAVMYDVSVENPTVLDYLRVGEVSSAVDEENTITIKLGNDLTASDGKYKLNLRGNGHMSAESTQTVTVAILTPALKASNLTAIRNATTPSSLASALGNVKDALQMDIPSDETSRNALMTEILKVKENDYNSTFATLNEVSEAYEKAEVIYYLGSAPTADGLMERVEKNATLFGIDKTDPDYIANKSTIYPKVISLKDTYKNTGIKTWQQLIQAMEETTAVEYINNSDIDDIDEAIAKYKTVIGISSTSYAGYLSLEDSGMDKVERQVYNLNFTTAEQIKAAFENAVTAEINSGQGGNLGDSSTPDRDIDVSLGDGAAEETDPVPVQPTERRFSDVADGHWANFYVEDLCQKGIISGYPDGTFKPENTVTREEFVKMIISAAGLYDENAECEFTDVDSSNWSYKYIASAKQSGIIGGISPELFGAGSAITREDVALIGARILDILKDTDKTAIKSATTSFADNDVISEYAMSGVAALVDLGIINGFEDNTFRPNEFITRAQAAKIIYMIRANI